MATQLQEIGAGSVSSPDSRPCKRPRHEGPNPGINDISQETRFCQTCLGILCRRTGTIDPLGSTETPDEQSNYVHHRKFADLEEAARKECRFCHPLWTCFTKEEQESLLDLDETEFQPLVFEGDSDGSELDWDDINSIPSYAVATRCSIRPSKYSEHAPERALLGALIVTFTVGIDVGWYCNFLDERDRARFLLTPHDSPGAKGKRKTIAANWRARLMLAPQM